MPEYQHLYESDGARSIRSKSLCGEDWRGVNAVQLARELRPGDPICENCRAVQRRRLARSPKQAERDRGWERLNGYPDDAGEAR